MTDAGKRFAPVLAAVCLMLPAGGAQADDPLSPVGLIALSQQMFRVAEARDNALLMISAAELRKSVRTTALDRAPEGEAAGEGAPMGWDDMLAAADGLIKLQGRPDLKELAQDIRESGTKGLVTGPGHSVATVAGGRTHYYRDIAFVAGVFADVYVEGAGNSNLDLYVKDSTGTVICSDTDASDVAYCAWMPSGAAAAVTIEVTNTGAAENRYSLITN